MASAFADSAIKLSTEGSPIHCILSKSPKRVECNSIPGAAAQGTHSSLQRTWGDPNETNVRFSGRLLLLRGCKPFYAQLGRACVQIPDTCLLLQERQGTGD